MSDTKIFVRRISREATTENLTTFFAQYHVIDVQRTPRKGFAIISLGHAVFAQAAIREKDGMLFMGKRVRVESFKEHKDKSSRSTTPSSEHSEVRNPRKDSHGSKESEPVRQPSKDATLIHPVSSPKNVGTQSQTDSTQASTDREVDYDNDEEARLSETDNILQGFSPTTQAYIHSKQCDIDIQFCKDDDFFVERRKNSSRRRGSTTFDVREIDNAPTLTAGIPRRRGSLPVGKEPTGFDRYPGFLNLDLEDVLFFDDDITFGVVAAVNAKQEEVPNEIDSESRDATEQDGAMVEERKQITLAEDQSEWLTFSTDMLFSQNLLFPFEGAKIRLPPAHTRDSSIAAPIIRQPLSRSELVPPSTTSRDSFDISDLLSCNDGSTHPDLAMLNSPLSDDVQDAAVATHAASDPGISITKSLGKILDEAIAMQPDEQVAKDVETEIPKESPRKDLRKLTLFFEASKLAGDTETATTSLGELQEEVITKTDTLEPSSDTSAETVEQWIMPFIMARPPEPTDELVNDDIQVAVRDAETVSDGIPHKDQVTISEKELGVDILEEDPDSNTRRTELKPAITLDETNGKPPDVEPFPGTDCNRAIDMTEGLFVSSDTSLQAKSTAAARDAYLRSVFQEAFQAAKARDIQPEDEGFFSEDNEDASSWVTVSDSECDADMEIVDESIGTPFEPSSYQLAGLRDLQPSDEEAETGGSQSRRPSTITEDSRDESDNSDTRLDKGTVTPKTDHSSPPSPNAQSGPQIRIVNVVSIEPSTFLDSNEVKNEIEGEALAQTNDLPSESTVSTSIEKPAKNTKMESLQMSPIYEIMNASPPPTTTKELIPSVAQTMTVEDFLPSWQFRMAVRLIAYTLMLVSIFSSLFGGLLKPLAIFATLLCAMMPGGVASAAHQVELFIQQTKASFAPGPHQDNKAPPTSSILKSAITMIASRTLEYFKPLNELQQLAIGIAAGGVARTMINGLVCPAVVFLMSIMMIGAVIILPLDTGSMVGQCMRDIVDGIRDAWEQVDQEHKEVES